MEQRRICSRCAMPETPGHITLDAKGVCNLCRRDENVVKGKTASFFGMDSERKIQALKNKLAKRRGSGKYDCAVAVSGGKDSLMALYIAKKELGLNPLGIFLDNGFSIPEMYENIQNASDILNVDLIMLRTNTMKNLFKVMLESRMELYYCRVCHLLLDKFIKDICLQHDIHLILGGYTKGQSYIAQDELFWIYDLSDRNMLTLLDAHPEFADLAEMFRNPVGYFAKHYKSIEQISPFKYFDYNEDDIIQLLKTELKFKVPAYSWPKNSTNCIFNFLAQYLARKQFGYSQHETEMSGIVRSGEMTRERALETLNSPITRADLQNVLNIVGVSEEILD